MNGNLKIINPEKDKRWDEFVTTHPLGLVYHHSAWAKVLTATYGYFPFYVGLEKPETHELSGVMPFMYINSKMTGKRLVSLPFTSYCTRLIPEPELERVVQFAMGKHPEVDFLELKFMAPLENPSGNFEARSGYVTHILDLNTNQQELFRSFHGTSIRQRIKRAEKNNLKLRLAENEQDLKKFYKLHVGVRKKHGLPPHPYSFFVNMWRFLRPHNLLLVPFVEDRQKVIAGAIVLKFKDRFYLEYTASDQKRLKESPNQLLIWEAIKMACNEGAKYFDFGRSALTNTFLIESKQRWATRRVKLQYYYYPRANGIDRENSLMRRILFFTNRFLPSPLLRLQGEIIYPHIG